MDSTHDSRFAWIAPDNAVPSIMTISEPVAFIGFGSALKGIALAAAVPAAKPRNARRFRSVGSFIAARLSPDCCSLSGVIKRHCEIESNHHSKCLEEIAILT